MNADIMDMLIPGVKPVRVTIGAKMPDGSRTRVEVRNPDKVDASYTWTLGPGLSVDLSVLAHEKNERVGHLAEVTITKYPSPRKEDKDAALETG